MKHFKTNLSLLRSITIILSCIGLSYQNTALAEERLALVIGNGAYDSIGALPNPSSDAELIARSLEAVGFETTVLIDADQYGMKKGIADFGRSLRKTSKDAVGLFFFAGHGVQAGGKNYLLPVEAEPVDSADLDLMGVEADWVLRQMESAGNKSNILILDACRNNPFVSSNRSLGRGLAQIDAPTGSFISYATAPGKVALDGKGANSPFSRALAKALPTPGLPLEQIFKKVRIDVLKETGGDQIPWDSSSLVEDVFLTSLEPVDAIVPIVQTQTVPASNELALLSSKETSVQDAPSESELALRAQKSRDVASYQAYLSQYPQGTFAEFFKAEIAFLQSKQTETITTLPDTALALADPTNPIDSRNSDSVGQSRNTNQVIDFLTRSLTLGAQGSLMSIEQLAQGKPQFPPFEGLPEAMWKDQSCSNCHSWEKSNLCEQGNFYLGKTEEALLRHKHPYGGKFKATLKSWAKQGCK